MERPTDGLSPGLVRALRGDFTDAERALAETRDQGALLALRALVGNTFPELASIPDAEEALASPGDGAAEALHQGALGAFLALDVPRLDRWVAALGSAATWTARASALFSWAEAVRAHLDGRGADLVARSDDLARAATAHELSDLLVDAAALRALGALASGSVDEAVENARRASRMARTEGLLQQEYFANVVLARVRRHARRAHLSVRILESLAGVVPAPWRKLVELELFLAGGLHDDASLRGRVTRLPDVLASAASGQRAAFDAAAGLALDDLAWAPSLRVEVETAIAMVDPTSRVDAIGAAEPWLVGRTDDPPFGIRQATSPDQPSAFVLAAPGRRPRRVLARGIALAPAEPARIESARQGTRTHLALAVATLAVDGLAPEALFEGVYRFSHEPAVHGDLLRGLLHRMRTDLGEAAELVRDGPRVRIEPRLAFIVPDPRCDEDLATRVLAHLSTGGGRATAREIASAMRLPLRTVQRVLGGLVDEGSCVPAPDGRRTEYVVEDTTFAEPSLHRLRGRR